MDSVAIDSFNKYLLSCECASDTMLGLRDVKIKDTPSHASGRSSSIKEINKLNIAVQVISAIKEVRMK